MLREVSASGRRPATPARPRNQDVLERRVESAAVVCGCTERPSLVPDDNRKRESRRFSTRPVAAANSLGDRLPAV